MAARRANGPPARRPRPGPGLAQPHRPPPLLARPDHARPGAGDSVAAVAGNALVTAARVGRLLGRSGWRMAKHLPGVGVVEQQVQRVAKATAGEVFRLLEMQDVLESPSSEEQRAMTLVRNADSGPEPLRSAMTELLERSAESHSGTNRDYLFGTIMSQLVPDEARILAALAAGRRFAAVDVVSKHVGRSATRTVLSNASTVGAAAGVSLPNNVGTYLTRLHGFGLVEFGEPGSDLDPQFGLLATDPAVQAARRSVGGARVVRKAVALSALGRDFWAASAPSRPALDRRTI